MATPILATKLYSPPLPLKVVTRSHLITRLNEGLSAGRKLTLISAPPGFGKSTLVSEWIASHERSAAWLSLDESDNDITRFLTYLIHALRTHFPNLGAKILDVLDSQQASSLEPILTALVNELTIIPNELILVLDDYHLVESKSIDNAITFLIEHLPVQVHLVITTREDPSLPIPRLRVRNQLTELRAADLRFTSAEAAEFLNQVMGLNLSTEDVAALETRTEGWIAGLQLAALSMTGQQDAHGFIQAFAGDHRFVVDYLIEEVLLRQSEDIRSFLLQTSILDRLNSSLCDAVTMKPGSTARLEQLQRGNLFLIALDDRRHWYRYHHLFADVLRMHLIAELSDQVPVLHIRASEWYEKNGLTADAIRHALAAKDFDRAAELIEGVLPVTRQNRQEGILLGWLQSLPEDVLQNRPVLNVHYAGTLLQNGQIEGVESRLRDAERWLNVSPEAHEQPSYVDAAEFQRLPAAVAMYHAAISLAYGQVDNTMKHARKVLDLVREADNFMSGAASSLLGLASWTSGDLETGYEMFSNGMAHLHSVGFISDVIGGSVTLADIRITQGRLRDAMNIYEHGLQLATRQDGSVLRGAADMHVGLSEIYRERNDLSTAEQQLLKSEELGELNGLPKNPYRWHVAMARITETQGEFDSTLELLDEAEPLYVGDFSPNVHPIGALKARIYVKQGELDKALDWAEERKLSAEEDPSYIREFEQITFARILLAKYQSEHYATLIHDVMRLLERLLKAAEEGGRIGTVIEILILQALAHQTQNDIPAALTSLERALTLAEPEGYIRMFVDEGEPMRLLILDFRSMIEVRGSSGLHLLIGYVKKLLSAFPKSMELISESKITNQESEIVEPLSQRELDILRLFKTELSGPEIANELVIALSTVRTHTKSIYAKLNVNSRRSAVKRALELGLI